MMIKKSRINTVLTHWAIIPLLAFSSCGFSHLKTAPATSGTGVTSTALNASVQPEALQILSTHCLSCHGPENKGGLSNITDPNYLVQAGLIVPGTPGSSLLIQYVSEGVMPPTNPLSASEIATLKTWVQGTTVAGSPQGTGTLAQQVTTIFTNNCLSCHGATGNGGLSNITNLSSLVQQGWIVPNNPAGSPIYSRVSGGTMPPSNPLSATDVQTIAAWINAGAPAN